MMTKQLKKWGTLFTAAAILSSCGENATGSADRNAEGADNIPVEEILFDIPSSVAAKSTPGLAKEADVEGDMFDAYRYVPAMIGAADVAKEIVKEIVIGVDGLNLEGEFTVEENNQIIDVFAVDTTILGQARKISKVEISSLEGDPILKLAYLKNDANEYKGKFVFWQHEGADSGNVAVVHFNTFHKSYFGSRLEVVFAMPEEGLVDEKVNDASVIRVRAVQKNGKVLVSGLSYHPNWEAEDEFWTTEPKIYGFVAAADSAKDLAMMKVGFAPATAARGELLTTYAIDKLMLQKGTDFFKAFLDTAEEATVRAVMYSIENEVSLLSAFGLVALEPSFAPAKTIAELDTGDLKTYLEANAELIEAGDDEGLKEFVAFVAVEQPLYFSSNGTLVGTSYYQPENWEAIVDGDDLGADELELASTTSVTEFDVDTDETTISEEEAAE